MPNYCYRQHGLPCPGTTFDINRQQLLADPIYQGHMWDLLHAPPPKAPPLAPPARREPAAAPAGAAPQQPEPEATAMTIAMEAAVNQIGWC